LEQFVEALVASRAVGLMRHRHVYDLAGLDGLGRHFDDGAAVAMSGQGGPTAAI
jgi:hypothetical protein